MLYDFLCSRTSTTIRFSLLENKRHYPHINAAICTTAHIGARQRAAKQERSRQSAAMRTGEYVADSRYKKRYGCLASCRA